MSLCLIDVHGDIEGDFEWAEELPRITNGDVIKALFGEPAREEKTGVLYKFKYRNGKPYFSTFYDWEWWNAPYKKNKKGVLESIAEKQKTLLDTTKAWNNYIDKNGNIY